MVAKRSTCLRLNVGAVLVQGRSIVSIGYNGAPSGAPHCTNDDCSGNRPCRKTIHAEINALEYLPYEVKMGNYGRALDLYVTDSPCEACFNSIQTFGRVKRIFFANPYRLNDHLTGHGRSIGIYRVLPSGYVVDWETKELADVKT